jgi:hypothetical protein
MTAVRFFELVDDMSVPGRWHLGTVEDSSGGEPRLLDAVRVKEAALHVAAVEAGTELDFCLTSFSVPIARNALADVIASIGRGAVQAIPVAIPGHRGFKVLNVVGAISCLDETRTRFTRWLASDGRPDRVGTYRMVIDLRVLPSAIAPEKHVFRIEGWRVGLVVSEVVKDAMEAEGCIGAQFIDVT